MKATASYGQFCPVAMAAEILCTRWTALVVREFLSGSTRFNELRRGVPLMSPALLSKRLKELEAAGVIRREAAADGGHFYRLTEAGEELRPVIMGLGSWGQRWIETDVALDDPDPALLMWDMRRNLDVSGLPPGRRVIRFEYPDGPPAKRVWWLVVEDGAVDLCRTDPGFPVDLYVESGLRTMTAIWMGLTTVAQERRAGRLDFHGDRHLGTAMQRWLGLSPFASEPKRVGAVIGRSAAE